MPYLAAIVAEINRELEANLLCDDIFRDRQAHGICQGMVRRKSDGEGVEVLPSYVNNEGEAKYVGPDDDYSLIIYHRVNSITVGKAANIRPFGDDRPADANVARMSLVVFGRRDVLQLSSDALAILLQAAMPDAASDALRKELQFVAANINVSDINLNDLQVFREEYQGIEFFLKPEQFLFKVNYTVESAFLKGCFKKCTC